MTAYPESALSETALAEGWLYRQLRRHMDIRHRIWNYFNLSQPNLIDVPDLPTLINGFETMLRYTYV